MLYRFSNIQELKNTQNSQRKSCCTYILSKPGLSSEGMQHLCACGTIVLLTFLPAQDLVYSAPKFPGPTIGMMPADSSVLSGFRSRNLIQGTCKAQSPCVLSSVTPLEISPGPLGVLSQGKGSSHPTHQGWRRRGKIANQGP